MRKKGFTLIELLVVIAIIAMLMAILMPALSKVKKIAMRVVCGTNLKGLGTAQTVYANDYDDEYVVQGGKATSLVWRDRVAGGWQNPNKAWTGTQTLSIGSSLYLLVREADVSPKSFVCPASDETEYDGENTNNLDIVQLWDFGNPDTLGAQSGPRSHVSFSYHMPYGSSGTKSRYAASGTLSAAFATMADKNPFLDHKLRYEATVTEQTLPDVVSYLRSYWDTTVGISESSPDVQCANAQPHDRESQNVLFADGHTSNEKTSDVGVKNDNIYTPWTTASPTDEAHIRKGSQAVMNTLQVGTIVDPLSQDDSLLMNDDDQ